MSGLSPNTMVGMSPELPESEQPTASVTPESVATPKEADAQIARIDGALSELTAWFQKNSDLIGVGIMGGKMAESEKLTDLRNRFQRRRDELAAQQTPEAA